MSVWLEWYSLLFVSCDSRRMVGGDEEAGVVYRTEVDQEEHVFLHMSLKIKYK